MMHHFGDRYPVGFNIDIASSLVTVDHSHNHYCTTGVEGNPVTITLGGKNGEPLKVSSIFGRNKGRKEPGAPGDNCPMLYALKGLQDLRTTSREIAKLHKSYRMIMAGILNGGMRYDWIVPMPSSSVLSTRFAKKICKTSAMGTYVDGALTKITGGHLQATVGDLQISSKEKAQLKAEIKRFIQNNGPDAPYQIKSLKPRLRRLVNPLALGEMPAGVGRPGHILLVDDMITTGTSLLCASRIIREHYPAAIIEAMTIFGKS